MTEPGASRDGPPPLADGAELSPDRVDPSLDGASNPRSIWPAIYPELLELVREHTSTIVFVNNRRGAERLAKRLNELANEERAEELPATEQAGTPRARRPAEQVSRSPAPITARSPTRSASTSRSCSSRESCPAWSRPRRSSWGSTWGRSTW